ncbi:SUKH-4 family immunity protein [Kitasatospora camelliae]|uniref:SUKH-4 family immunity protein n=1 Tax=Kitasatospora camelliae TaxID=3156397 RepID=A0AAU8JN28_9ACTN
MEETPTSRAGDGSLEAGVGLPAGARDPDAAWLDRIFGPERVWRPSERELPGELTHGPTREFLTTVGLPCVWMERIGLDSRSLRLEGLWAQNADEAYAVSRPLGAGAVADSCFKLMEHPDHYFMLDGDSGGIDLFLPDKWDWGRGYGGRYASSVAEFVAVVGLAALTVKRVDDMGLEPALVMFEGWLDELGLLAAYPDLWSYVFEYLDEYFDDES